MQYTTDFQTHYDDHRRQMTWVNDEGWKFDPPHSRTRVRERLARALIVLALRLGPAPGQPRTA